MKTCTKCGEEKSVKEFSKQKTHKDGLRSWCKECIKRDSKRYREENKEKINKQHKQYREENKEKIEQYRKENKEKIKEYHKQYYEENKEKKKEYYKQYSEKNKEKIKEYKKQYRKKNKEKLFEQGKRYREENKEKIKEDKKRYNKEEAKYDTYAEQISFCEEVRRDPNDRKLLQVKCIESDCRKWFNPTNLEIRNRIVSLNGKGTGENRFYCSEECKQECCLYQQTKYPKGFVKENDISRSYPEYIEWREEVYKRDNYTCQKCKERGIKLNAHHIESYDNNPKLRTEISNGITFCTDCHNNFHHIYGNGNNTRKQLNKFMRCK